MIAQYNYKPSFFLGNLKTEKLSFFGFSIATTLINNLHTTFSFYKTSVVLIKLNKKSNIFEIVNLTMLTTAMACFLPITNLIEAFITKIPPRMLVTKFSNNSLSRKF